MKPNVPWSVKGIDPEARAVAKEAARKANMTLGEWMNQMIREMGEEQDAPGAPQDAPAPVSGVTTEQLRAVVDSLNRLNDRLKTTEDELKVTEARQRQVAGDLGQGLETVFERMKRLERERAEGTPEKIEERVEALERGEGDKGRIEGLIKLESALTHMVEALEVTRAEALDKIEENEVAVQALATRVETLDDRLTAGFAEVHDAIDAVGQHLDRTERTAQAVIQDAKEAAASTDAQFVEATSKRLMILGTEIKRSGDQIRTVEEMVGRLSDKIEAAEHRSAEGIGEVAASLEGLRAAVLTDEDGAVRSDSQDAQDGSAASLGATRESLAEAAAEADKKVSRLQRSYEMMMARLEGRPVTEDDTPEVAALAPIETAQPTDEDAVSQDETDAPDAGDTGDAAATADRSAKDQAAGAADTDNRPAAGRADPVINDTVAAGLGLMMPGDAAPSDASAREGDASDRRAAPSSAQDEDFDEIFGAPTVGGGADDLPPLPGAALTTENSASRTSASTPLAATSERVSASLGETDAADAADTKTPAAAGDAPDAEGKPDLAKLTPRQKVLLAAKARKRRLEAERAEAEGDQADADDGQDADAAAVGTDAKGTADILTEDDLVLAGEARDADRPRRFGARNLGLAALFLVAAGLVWFYLSPRGGDVAERPAAPAEQEANGRLASPSAPASQPTPPAGPSARALYDEGVAAYDAGRFEEAFALFVRAQNDYVPAKMRVGFALLNGVGTAPDFGRARAMLLDAANSGNIAAMHTLGNIAANADLGGVDVAGALDWFERAAEAGNINSMYNLGYLLDPTEQDQDIVPMGERDPARAYEWYSLAAALGDTIAATEAGEVGAVLTPEAREAIDLRVAGWTPRAVVPSVNDGLNPPTPPLN